MAESDGVKLSDLIAPSFYSVHWDIMDEKHTYYDCYGGRGSTKSSFIGIEIVLGIMQDLQVRSQTRQDTSRRCCQALPEVCWRG